MAEKHDFRIVGGKYFHNNEEVSPEIYKEREAAVNQAIRDFQSAPVPGLEDLESFAADSKARAAARKNATRKKAGGVIKSASSRADGIAQRGKTKGKMR